MIDPDDLDVSMSDIRRAGFCPHMRDWFRAHDLSAEFAVLVKGGTIPASLLLSTGDPNAELVVRRTMEGRLK